MTQDAKTTLKELNRKYFDDNIKEMQWSSLHTSLVLIMKDKQLFKFQGDVAEAIYKQLVKNSMQ
jgi:hypothetical protein